MKIVPCMKTLVLGLFLVFVSCNNQPAQSDVKFKISDLWNKNKKTSAQMAKEGEYLQTAAASTNTANTLPKVNALPGDITNDLRPGALRRLNVSTTTEFSRFYNAKQKVARGQVMSASFDLVPRDSSDMPIEMMIWGDKNMLSMRMPKNLVGEELDNHCLRVREALALYLVKIRNNRAFKEGDIVISTAKDQFGITFFKVTKNPNSQLTLLDLNDSLNFLNEQYQLAKFNYD